MRIYSLSTSEVRISGDKVVSQVLCHPKLLSSLLLLTFHHFSKRPYLVYSVKRYLDFFFSIHHLYKHSDDLPAHFD